MADLDDITGFPLCLGGNVFGWTADEAASTAVLDDFVGAGGRLVDTADVYSSWATGNCGGESETIIGEWLRHRGDRNALGIATKVGKLAGLTELSASNVRRAAENSLRRLQRDHIDLYYLHDDDPTTELPETLGALDSLVRDGLVRFVGASNFTAARLSEALAVQVEHGFARFAAVQPNYSLLHRQEYESELAALCRENGIAVFAYYALAEGYLTGKYRGAVPTGERAEDAIGYDDERGRAVLAVLDAVAAAHHVRPAAVALAWLASRPGLVVPIASARNSQQLADLLAVAGLELSDTEQELLTAASGGASD